MTYTTKTQYNRDYLTLSAWIAFDAFSKKTQPCLHCVTLNHQSLPLFSSNFLEI